MEDYLLTVKEELVEVVDDGISLQIVEAVRDLIHLDFAAILEVATSVSEICAKLQEYVQIEPICSAGLERIVYLWDAGVYCGYYEGQEFFTAGGIEMLTTIMSNHINSLDIQTNGCKLIHKLMQWTFYDHVRPLLESVVNAVVNAIRNYPDHIAVQEAAYASFPLMQIRFTGVTEPSFAHFLAKAGGVPLLFSSLERYPLNNGVGTIVFFHIKRNRRTLPLRTYISKHPKCHAIISKYLAANSNFLPM